MSKYLKESVYCNDLYDLWTIEECLRKIVYHNKYSEESLINDTDNKLSKEEKILGFKTILDLHLYYIKGNRYREKESIIEKWVNRDKDYDNKVDSARCPEKIDCLICSKNMKVVSKELYLGIEPVRV